MRPPPRGVTTTTPPLGIELEIQKVARARVFFQDCVILPGGTQSVKLKTREKLKKNLHCLAVRTEIRTGNFFILPFFLSKKVFKNCIFHWLRALFRNF